MRVTVFALIVVFMCGLAAVGADLDGQKVVMKTGDSLRRNVVLKTECGADVPENARIVATGEKTGKDYPVTLRDGELVIVTEGGLPDTEYTYTLRVEEMTAASPAPRVVIKKQDDKDIVDVFIDDEHFTSYHYSEDWKKPFLWPVNGEDGHGLTRAWPMDEDADTPEYAQDHVHHKSLYTAYGEVQLEDGDVADLWGEGGGSGWQHVNEVTWGSGDAYGWIVSKNTWQNGDREPLIDETREYRFYSTPADARFIDVAVTFDARYGKVTFKDTKEGGLVALRMSPEISYRNGKITNARGDEGEQEAWGRPAAWCDYSADVEDIGWRGIAVFDHPENLRHPTCWHVRKYGLMGANSFGYSYFSDNEAEEGSMPENGDYVFEEDGSLTFNYRVYVHSGSTRRANVKARFADYAAPPVVTTAE
ncbi:MAG: PmoA family protein [Candidatus Hydrogenedentota bacterium]